MIEHAPHDHMTIPKYLGVFGILVVGTILTYLVATVDMDWIFPGMNTLVALLDRVYENGVRHAVFHARLLEPEAHLAGGDRELLLAGDHVCLYDAGLSDPRLQGVFGG